MGLRAPFGYVGYEWQMPKLACDILELLCQWCHTNRDYQNGCHSCPAGVMFYACKEYVLNAQEEDKHYHEYTTKTWLDKREEYYGKRNSPEETARWQKMSEDSKPEARQIRKLKRLFKKLEPCPYLEGGDSKFDFTEHHKAIETIRNIKEAQQVAIKNWLEKRIKRGVIRKC